MRKFLGILLVLSAAALDTYVEEGFPGVKIIESGDEGDIRHLIVVGSASVDESLPPVKAKNKAFKIAEANARKEFSKFLGSSVTVSEVHETRKLVLNDGGKITRLREKNDTVRYAAHSEHFMRDLRRRVSKINSSGDAIVIFELLQPSSSK